MQDKHIELDEPSTLESATAHHWAEIHKHGETTFHSDEEVRVVSKDLVMRGVLDELDDKKLYESVMYKGTLKLSSLRDSCRNKINQQMEEALHDYYS